MQSREMSGPQVPQIRLKEEGGRLRAPTDD